MAASIERSFVALTVGGLATVLGRRVAVLVVDWGFVVFLTQRGLSQDQGHDRMANEPLVMLGGLVVGLVAIAIGGFTTGRIAGHAEPLHGAGAGVVSVLVSLVLLVAGARVTQPLGYVIVAYVLTIPSAVLGGYVAKWTTMGAHAPSGVPRGHEPQRP